MDTDIKPLGPSVWLQLSNAQQEVEQIPRQNSSHLTIDSHETDSTNITSTTHSSIRTNINNSTSSLDSNRDLELREQYEQRPEKVPDVAAEMEKWYALTDRYTKENKENQILYTLFLNYIFYCLDMDFYKMIIPCLI
jgi:hypothetical protein